MPAVAVLWLLAAPDVLRFDRRSGNDDYEYDSGGHEDGHLEAHGQRLVLVDQVMADAEVAAPAGRDRLGAIIAFNSPDGESTTDSSG